MQYYSKTTISLKLNLKSKMVKVSQVSNLAALSIDDLPIVISLPSPVLPLPSPTVVTVDIHEDLLSPSSPHDDADSDMEELFNCIDEINDIEEYKRRFQLENTTEGETMENPTEGETTPTLNLPEADAAMDTQTPMEITQTAPPEDDVIHTPREIILTDLPTSTEIRSRTEEPTVSTTEDTLNAQVQEAIRLAAQIPVPGFRMIEEEAPIIQSPTPGQLFEEEFGDILRHHYPEEGEALIRQVHRESELQAAQGLIPKKKRSKLAKKSTQSKKRSRPQSTTVPLEPIIEEVPAASKRRKISSESRRPPPTRSQVQKTQGESSAPKMKADRKGKKIRKTGEPDLFDASSHESWPQLSKRKILPMRDVDTSQLSSISDIMIQLRSQKLERTVVGLKPYCKKVIYEFCANLVPSCYKADSDRRGTVYMRGQTYQFDAQIINEVFHTPSTDEVMEVSDAVLGATLSGNRLTDWNGKHTFCSSSLSMRYAILHRIALYNWMPSTHTSIVQKKLLLLLFKIGTRTSFNFGQLVMEQIIKARQSSTSGLPFPNLIQTVLEHQGFQIAEEDVYEPLEPKYKVTKLLISPPHVHDLGVPAIERRRMPRDVPPHTTSSRLDEIKFLQASLSVVRHAVENLQSHEASMTARLAELIEEARTQGSEPVNIPGERAADADETNTSASSEATPTASVPDSVDSESDDRSPR